MQFKSQSYKSESQTTDSAWRYFLDYYILGTFSQKTYEEFEFSQDKSPLVVDLQCKTLI